MSATEIALVTACSLQGLGCLAALLLVLRGTVRLSEDTVKDLAWNYARMFQHGWQQGCGDVGPSERVPWEPTIQSNAEGPTAHRTNSSQPDFPEEDSLVGMNPPMVGMPNADEERGSP